MMNKIFTLSLKKGLIGLVFLSLSISAQAQIVNIPDANFKAALVADIAINTNADGEIQVSEASAYAGGINVAGLGISDLTGIEAFTALQALDCSNNILSTLNVAANTALTNLNCDLNQLTSLDVTTNVFLNVFLCRDNLLTSLDVSSNTLLSEFRCSRNDISILDVSNQPFLSTFACAGNLLTSIDVSTNTNLFGFYCNENLITNLDVSNNTALFQLWCYGNQISSLDFSNNLNLGSIECRNNLLTSLDLSANVALFELACDNNPIVNLDLSQNSALTTILCANMALLTSLNIQNGNNANLVIFNVTSNPFLSCIQVDDVAFMNTNWSAAIDPIASYSTLCFVWTGNTNTNWNNAGNWSDGNLPSIGNNAIIPSSPFGGNFPTVNNNVELNQLNVQTGATLIVNGGFTLTVNNNLINDGQITIQSSGALVQALGSTLTGLGNYTIRRQVSAGNRFIGSPIDNHSISSFGITANGTNGGQIIPDQGNPCNSVSIDPTSPFGNIMEIIENPASVLNNCAQSLWHVRSTGGMLNGRGYVAYASTPTLLSFNGTVNNGNISYTGLTRQSGNIDQWNGTQTRGWHLVSNPYPSPIRITNGDLGAGFDNSVYVFNGSNFIPINLNVSDAVIAVGQGFQIRKSIVGGTSDFSLNNALREGGNPVFYSQNPNITQYMNIGFSGPNGDSEVMVYFDDNANENFDPQFDANCLFGQPIHPKLYTTESDGEQLSIDARPTLANEPIQSIPLSVYDAGAGSHQLFFENLSSIPGVVFLNDLLLNTQNIITDGYVYNFTTHPGDSRDRFMLSIYGNNPVGIANVKDAKVMLFPNPANDQINLQLPLNHKFNSFEIVDITGRTCLLGNINNKDIVQTVSISNIENGIYFIRFIGSETVSLKFTKK
jgi:hypothetical protein